LLLRIKEQKQSFVRFLICTTKQEDGFAPANFFVVFKIALRAADGAKTSDSLSKIAASNTFETEYGSRPEAEGQHYRTRRAMHKQTHRVGSCGVSPRARAVFFAFIAFGPDDGGSFWLSTPDRKWVTSIPGIFSPPAFQKSLPAFP